MKRYLLFASPEYYPGGGSADVVAEADALSDLKERIERELKEDSGVALEILDLDERRWISEKEVIALVK